MRRTRKAPRVEQPALFRRGGKRPGAGRKPNGPKPMVSHAARPPLTPRHPVLVTTRLCPGLPSLRNPGVRAVLLRAIRAGSDRPGFRIVEISIQTNHLHSIAEAQDATALSRGLQGLHVRIARALNKHWRRKGRVFVDRYHERILRTPFEVRNALVYVLQNVRKHGVWIDGPDPYTSGPWFDGWRPGRFGADRGDLVKRLGPRPTPGAKSWLLTTGWRIHGLIDSRERPKEQREAAALRTGRARSSTRDSPTRSRST